MALQIQNPITAIFGAFTNPPNSKYAFFGAEKGEVILMNDTMVSRYDILAGVSKSLRG